MHRTRRSWRLAASLLALLILGACQRDDHWQLKDVSGLLPDLHFELPSTAVAGGPVTARHFRGEVVLVYFGYSHCPDVCPTTLAQLRIVLASLPRWREQLRVLFVSVDPARDTVPVLQDYVRYFGPRFVGLRPDPQQLEDLARRYRVAYEADPPGGEGGYAVAHSNGVFIFDRRGKARLLATGSDSGAAIEADLRRLLRGG